jgi:hypothetical protein
MKACHMLHVYRSSRSALERGSSGGATQHVPPGYDATVVFEGPLVVCNQESMEALYTKQRRCRMTVVVLMRVLCFCGCWPCASVFCTAQVVGKAHIASWL